MAIGGYRVKLTETKIKNTRADEKAKRLSDGRGLYLYISPSGGKLWRAKYRFEGREKLISYGKYPDSSLVDARKKHEEALKLLADGTDPMVERKAEKATVKASFQNIAEDWHAHWSEGKTQRHAEPVFRRLKADVFPAIGKLAIAEIEAPALVRLSFAHRQDDLYWISSSAQRPGIITVSPLRSRSTIAAASDLGIIFAKSST